MKNLFVILFLLVASPYGFATSELILVDSMNSQTYTSDYSSSALRYCIQDSKNLFDKAYKNIRSGEYSILGANDANYSCKQVIINVKTTHSSDFSIFGTDDHQWNIFINVWCEPRPLAEKLMISLGKQCEQQFTRECVELIEKIDAVKAVKYKINAKDSCIADVFEKSASNDYSFGHTFEEEYESPR